MTKEEMLRIMRLLSALESVSIAKVQPPDYLHDEISELVLVLEREILK
jgi:hypothetical protein